MAGNLVILGVLYKGGLMMTDAQISVGELTSFLMYAAYVAISFGGFSSFYAEIGRAVGASSRLWELIDRVPTIPLKGGLYPDAMVTGNIQFDNVTFSYPSRLNARIFHQLNLYIPTGSVLAVVGSSGSGKSTIAGLLLRFYDPDEGNVRVDGHDIRELDPRWLRHQIGTVSQEPILFTGTIKENIIYACNDSNLITDEHVENAARQANALQFIRSFPHGFDTIVGERGVMLSGKY
ncbi:ABCB10 (predicted) [Pycnogonum litorale]